MAAHPTTAHSKRALTITTVHSLDKSRFRFPANAKRYTNEQLETIFRSPQFMLCVMVDDRGLVKSNFAYAKVANVRYCEVDIVRFSDMTRSDVEGFIKVLKTVSKRNGWSQEMLDIELQFLSDYR